MEGKLCQYHHDIHIAYALIAHVIWHGCIPSTLNQLIQYLIIDFTKTKLLELVMMSMRLIKNWKRGSTLLTPWEQVYKYIIL